MLVKIAKLEEFLSKVKKNGITQTVRWGTDDSGQAVLMTADVGGKAYEKSRDVLKVETKKNMDVFYTDLEIAAGAKRMFTFDKLPHYSNCNDVSQYKTFDLTIRSKEPHEFYFTDASGFRTIDLEFGEFSFFGSTPNIKKISDMAYKNSLESNSPNHRYLVCIETKIVQSLFNIQVENNGSQTHLYHAELRLYR